MLNKELLLLQGTKGIAKCTFIFQDVGSEYGTWGAVGVNYNDPFIDGGNGFYELIHVDIPYKGSVTKTLEIPVGYVITPAGGSNPPRIEGIDWTPKEAAMRLEVPDCGRVWICVLGDFTMTIVVPPEY